MFYGLERVKSKKCIFICKNQNLEIKMAVDGCFIVGMSRQRMLLFNNSDFVCDDGLLVPQ